MSVNNTLIIAQKELSDIVNNKWVLIVLIIYLFMVLSFILDVNDQSTKELNDEQLFSVMFGWSQAIISYGTIIGIMIGFFTISNEKYNKTLNTLLSKPLYRDTIINGKLIACIGFLLLLFGLTVAIYISLMLILYGNSAYHFLIMVLDRLPIIFFISFLYVIIYMLLSMMVSIIVRRQSVALLFSILLYVLMSSILATMSFAGNIYHILGGQIGSRIYYYFINLLPDCAYQLMVMHGLNDPSRNIFSVLNICWANFFLFPLYVIVLIVLCYISFLRRDSV
jgi:ABC-2 type transport system permease protein